MDSALDSAIGPPGVLVERREELTPMMRQYVECCERYDDSLVLFHVGDFYKTFCGAAEVVARLCELTLTEREDSSGTYAMAGIPVDRAESYVETLLDAGYRVAIAEQVEDPEAVTGVAERAVTRVVTPGTLTEAELLDARDNNFVACLAVDESDPDGPDEASDGFGLALLDVSTGEFYATGPSTESAVRDEVGRFAPTEAIVGPGVPTDLAGAVFDGECAVAPFEDRAFDPDAASELVADYFGPPDALLAGPAEVRACGALLAYAEYVRGGETGRLDYLTRLTRYDPREHLLVDRVALRSLELFEPRSVHGREDATLVGVLDGTASAIGSRKLKDWLRRPLLDEARIEARLDAVAELVHAVQVRESIHDHLRAVYDLERLISRVSRGRANARDLRSLQATLDVVPEVEATLDDAESGKLRSLRDDLDDLAGIRDLVARAIREDPPVELTEGGLIRRGYDDDLDDLRATERDGKEWVDSLEASERERTGIDSLKVGYNEVHGYYVEVTRPNLDRVPDEYVRRQTLKNAERFYTPELKEREDEIVRAAARAADLEYRLFREVRDRVAAETERVQALAATLAELDVLVALAAVAAQYGYARPEVGADAIEIRDGRHPVVERAEDRFVPNDAVLDRDGFLAIVTGPNMSGKSTYMRQVALVCLLAQVGSFVPASEARLPLLDRVFTRVGASDDIAGGRSTFMVEMTELAAILREATPDSLVLLDEVGRGTSTADGLAIARAVTEHLHDEVGAWTLFATHHHDLTALDAELDGVVTRHFSARQDGNDVVFDHEVAPGAAEASYGVEVARQAGVPESVVRRSRELVGDDRDCDERDGAAAPAPDDGGAMANGGESADGTAGPLDDSADPDDAVEAVLAELRDLPLAETTPLEALNALGRLQARLDGDD